MTLRSLHHAVVGIADSTLEVCLLASLRDAAALDLTQATGIRSLRLDPGVSKRPEISVVCCARLFVASPAPSIRVPIHITQVPRG
jgi:hypothetical protein